MCGICGIITREPIQPHDEMVVQKINHALVHRGPDGERLHQDEHIILAMRRLSIIDLASGWQPIYNEDDSLVVICNGEILNYIELHAMLKERGHTFSTNGDVETILHLYEEYGMDFVQHLRGQFAFALYDRTQNKVIIGRDRIGEKPLHIYQNSNKLVFASEIKALLQDESIPFELNPTAIDLYLHYYSIPEPLTPIKAIRKLQAGHLLTVDIANWTIEEHPYWQIAPTNNQQNVTIADIRAELETVAEIIVRADVPVGIALSGGLDSSVIGALTTQKYPDTMHAFSIGYSDESPTDESRYAQELANQLGMPFHKITLSTEDMVNTFAEVVYWRDDLVADISGYGYYSVAKSAKENNIRVLLMGHGGDELFWGYDWLRHTVIDNIVAQKGLSIRDIWRYVFNDVPKTTSFSAWKKWLGNTLRGTSDGMHRLKLIRHKHSNRLIFWDSMQSWQYKQQITRSLYTSNFNDAIPAENAYLPFTFDQPVTDIPLAMTRLIMQKYMAQVGISQGDRLGMAHSVELRLPLVDYKLIETVLNYRQDHPDHLLDNKATFKEAIRDVLPTETLNRPKRGFEPPVKKWYRALKERYQVRLLDGYLVQQNILKHSAIRALLDESSYESLEMTFKLLCLEIWCQTIRKIHL